MDADLVGAHHPADASIWNSYLQHSPFSTFFSQFFFFLVLFWFHSVVVWLGMPSMASGIWTYASQLVTQGTGAILLKDRSHCGWSSSPHPSSGLLSLLCTRGRTHGPASCCHACRLLLCLPAFMDSYASATLSQNRFLIVYVALTACCQGRRKGRNVSRPFAFLESMSLRTSLCSYQS